MAKSDNQRNDRILSLRAALGIRIRTLRKARGINQDDFADMVGIQRAHVGLIENAKVEPRFGTLILSRTNLVNLVSERSDSCSW